jgi:hypothetical protein
MQALKALESVVPNKQVGKWADLRKMFTENKNVSSGICINQYTHRKTI